MYWYTWVILVGVLNAIAVLSIIGAMLSGRSRGWRALCSEFPVQQIPDADAFTGRSTMFVFAPGEEPKRYGCLAFFMPWTWKYPLSVRFASDAQSLFITLDEGVGTLKQGAQIPFSELMIADFFTVKLAYTFWGGQFGKHASLRAGSCTITVPVAQFQHELLLLHQFGQIAAPDQATSDGPLSEPHEPDTLPPGADDWDSPHPDANTERNAGTKKGNDQRNP